MIGCKIVRFTGFVDSINSVLKKIDKMYNNPNNHKSSIYLNREPLQNEKKMI